MAVIGMSLVLRPVFMGVSVAMGIPVAVRIPVLMPMPVVAWTDVLRAIVARVCLAARVVTRLWCAATVHFLPRHRAIVGTVTTARSR